MTKESEDPGFSAWMDGRERSADARDEERTAHRTEKEERRRVRRVREPRWPEAPVRRTRGAIVLGDGEEMKLGDGVLEEKRWCGGEIVVWGWVGDLEESWRRI